jgi:hypothetical protein
MMIGVGLENGLLIDKKSQSASHMHGQPKGRNDIEIIEVFILPQKLA